MFSVSIVEQVCYFHEVIFFEIYFTCSFSIQDGLNLSSPQLLPQTSDNRTIKNFVKTYVDTYIGG